MSATQKVSDEHSLSREQIEAAAGLVAREARPKRWLIGVTQGYRALAKHQFIASQFAFMAAVPAIVASAWSEPNADRRLLLRWCGVAAVLFILRIVAARPLFVESPAIVARSIVLRTMPLVMALSAAAFWAVSTFLFVGPELRPPAVVMIIAFIALSIPMAGMGPSVPIAATLYIAILWTSMFIRLLQLTNVSSEFVLTIIFLVVVCSIVTLIVVLQVRPRLERVDKIDLLTADLVESNEELKLVRIRLQRRNTFFAAANHDFRQRLHALKLMSATSLADKSLSERSSRALRTLADEVQNLDAYLTDILDFARIESTSPEPDLRDCALHEIFQDIDLHFEAIAESRRVELRARLTPVILHTDAAMLQRMIENLVSNALKFTKGAVLLAARRSGDALHIEVWDCGPGIAADALENIFQAFHQNDLEEPIENRGVGLGLAVVHRFAETLGYRISVRSNLGKGSVFRIHVPHESIRPGAVFVPGARLHG